MTSDHQVDATIAAYLSRGRDDAGPVSDFDASIEPDASAPKMGAEESTRADVSFTKWRRANALNTASNAERVTMPWGHMVTWLSTGAPRPPGYVGACKRGKPKEAADLSAWSPAVFAHSPDDPKHDARLGLRQIGNVVHVTALVADIDKGGHSLETIRAAYGGRAAVIHSTRNYTAAAPVWRVVSAQSRPTTREEHAIIWELERERLAGLGIFLDAVVHDSCRIYFSPVLAADGSYESAAVEGAPVNVDAMLERARRFALPQEPKRARSTEAAGAPQRTDARALSGGALVQHVHPRERELARISMATRKVRAAAWLQSVEGAVGGKGDNAGEKETMRVCTAIVSKYSLGDSPEAREVLAPFFARCSPPWTDTAQINHKIAEAMRHGMHVWGEKLLERSRKTDSTSETGERSDGKPTIPAGTDLARQVDQAIAAMREDPELYVRAGSLTRVIATDGTEIGLVQREAGAPVMRRADATFIRECLSRDAVFTTEKTKGRGESRHTVEVEIQAPPWIASHVVQRGTWPGYRPLVGIVTSPTMRRDGSVVQAAGYDAPSGLLLVPNTTYAAVNDEPKVRSAIAARDRLLDVIVDFPLDDLGRAGWLSLLFTLVARELVEGSVPLFAVDAHTAASGKGLLVRTAHLIAFGSDIPHMSMPPDDEEFRKQITTTLLAGDRAILFDNVTQPIGGDSLEALITAPVWKARLLGTNENSGSIVPRIVTTASGNGIQLVGDMGRRTLRLRLDSPHENPEERRDYTHKDRAGEDRLLGWVREHRAELVVDALTCLRAWHVHGRAGETQPREWGSFNGWTATIASAVMWLGLPDPSEARATKDATLDPALQALDVIYAALERLTHKRSVLEPNEPLGLTAGDLVRAAFASQHGAATGEDELAEAIDALVPSRADAATKARVLGRKLKVGRIIQGRKLVSRAERSRAVRYCIEPATR